MRLPRSMVLVAALAVSAVPAQAQTTLFSGDYTGGNTFNTTASITLTYNPVSSGVYLFSLNVTNLGNYDAVFRAIGLFNLPSYTLVSSSTSLPGWHLPPPDDLSGDGLTPQTVSYISGDPSPKQGLQVGGSGTFTFEISGFTRQGQVDSVGAGIHAISGPNGCSTKLGVQNGAVVATAPPPGDCSSVVPEPATVALLATGLLGLLGFAYVRHTV